MAKNKAPVGKKPPKPNDDTDDNADDTESSVEDDGDEDSGKSEEDENRRLNAIVTNRVKREMKPLLNQLAAIQDSLKNLAPAPKKEEESSDGDDEDEKPVKKLDPKLARQISKMEKELAEAKAAREQAEKDRADEQERSRVNDMRNVFSSALSELGCTNPVMLRAALNLLQEDGIMIRDDDGKVKFKGTDKYGIETNFDPKIGLKQWITSAEGKAFVPAIDAGGSGSGGSRGGGSSGLTSKEISKMSDYDKAQINFDRAFSGLPPIGEDK